MSEGDWTGNSNNRRKKKIKENTVPTPDEIKIIKRIMDMLA
jgi:hypothetical protein